jgi:hypothetical protein
VRVSALVTSSSKFRCFWYSDRLPRHGIDVEIAKGGVDCIQTIRTWHPDIVILETSLLWGGCDGVLALRRNDSVLQRIPFLLVAIEELSHLTYRLARYQPHSFLVRDPTIDELITTVHLIRHGIYVHEIADEPSPTESLTVQLGHRSYRPML